MEVSYSKSLSTKTKHYIWTYSDPILSGYTIKKRNKFEALVEGGGSVAETQGRRPFSLSRTRSHCKYLIELNITPYTKFATFTFKEAPQGREEAIKRLKTFARRYRQTYNEKLNYLYVLEKGSGSGTYIDDKGHSRTYSKRWHVHAVIFNNRYITLTDMRKLWRYGSARINKIDQTSNVSLYLMKYITEDTMLVNNKKGYISSQGLIQPHYTRHSEPIRVDENICSYIKHYTIPIFKNGIKIGERRASLYEIPIIN